MTISLLIRYKDPEKANGYFPVSTNDIFKQCWLPGCHELNLNFVSLFLTGYPILELDLATLPQVIDELKQLKDYFTDKETTFSPICDAEFLSGRVDRVIAEMSNALKMWDEIAYIRV